MAKINGAFASQNEVVFMRLAAKVPKMPGQDVTWDPEFVLTIFDAWDSNDQLPLSASSKSGRVTHDLFWTEISNY